MLETICDVMLDAYKREWITSRDGNASVRHHDRDYFYVTPSGVRKQTLQPDQFKKIQVTKGLRYTELPYTAISSNLKPSGELPLHHRLQRNLGQHSNDVRVVLHLHPTYCIAAMHRGIDLSTISKDFPELNRYTRVAPNVGDVAPISEELGKQCCENLGLTEGGHIDYDIVGIKGHGVVAVDTSPWRAYEHIERLSHICQIILVSGKFD